MASKTVVEWVDDIDGGPAAETVSFALDGVEYEIDLSTAHATQLRTALKEFIRKARPDGPGESKSGASAPVEDAPVEDDEEPGLLPAPLVSESSRHLPAPRSAIKSRIPVNQLAMDGFDEPAAKPARKAAPAKKEPAKAAPAKTAAAKTPAKTPAATAKTAASTAPAKPAATKPTAAKPAPQRKPKPQPKPEAKPAAQSPAAKPEPKQPPAPEPETPQRPTVASPFSQPAQPGATAPAAKKDTPPMITFSSAKQ